jgi:hypothetical protein
MDDATPAGPDKPVAPVKGKSKLNVDNAVIYLNANVRSYAQGSRGKCATKVEEALSAGGVDLPKPRALEDAKNKGSLLTGAGFIPVSTDTSANFPPQKGDVVVIQPYSNVEGKNSSHMAMFNGEEWVSDYYQDEGIDPYPGSHYDNRTPPYVIYQP